MNDEKSTDELSSGKSVDVLLIDEYRKLVAQKHPTRVSVWPILAGYDYIFGRYREWVIFIFKSSSIPAFKNVSNIGELESNIIGYETISDENKSQVRERIKNHFRLKRQDAVFIFDEREEIIDDLKYNLLQHEIEMELCPMKIFLSHKGADEAIVREYERILKELGFDPWLAEELPAGNILERALLKGFKDSCAAVFFITPRFKDEKYLATEVNYAIQQIHEKGDDRFKIVSILFPESSQKVEVPELLTPYTYKEPSSHLEALWEIIRAIPIRVGPIMWK